MSVLIPITMLMVASGVGANLLKNPSFEQLPTSVVVTEPGYGQAYHLEGWDSHSDGVIPMLSGWEGISAADGSNWIDPVNSAFQNVSTFLGSTYLLSFYMRNGPFKENNETLDEAIYVEWNGEVVGSFKTSIPDVWERKEIKISGTGRVDQLLFRKLHDEETNAGDGPFLDKVDFSLAEKTSTSIPTSTCRVPKLVGDWEVFKPYPLRVTEAQGRILGNDFVVVSGFTDQYTKATDTNHALDLNDSGASWRKIAPLPVEVGITHGATTVIGDKLYMVRHTPLLLKIVLTHFENQCGGYLGGHPGPAIDTCLVYDYSSDSWEFFESLPQGRAGGGLVYSSVSNALIFAAGAVRPRPGDIYAEDHQSTWMYQFDKPEAGWVPMANIPYKSNHMSSGKCLSNHELSFRI